MPEPRAPEPRVPEPRAQAQTLTTLATEAPDADVAPLPAPPPSRFDDDGALPAHADPVADYTLSATLDPDTHTVHGEGTLHWKNASSVPVREVWIHLYLNAFKNERSTFLREPVGDFRGGATPSTWGHIDVRRFALREGPDKKPVELWQDAELRRAGDVDETDVRVPLPREIAPGEAVTFEMTWDDKLPSIVERTGFDGTFHMVAQWFPKIARLEPDGRWAHFAFHHLTEFYADYGTYDVTLDVPDTYTVGATGPAQPARIEGGRRVERRVQSDVHDFAWMAWANDKCQTFTDTVEGVNVTVIYPPGFRVVALRELTAMRVTLPFFNKHFGKYPYPTLTIVHPPESAHEAGGMEYPTLITTGGSWIGPPGVLTPELVTVHEYGHQYFYGLLGSDEVNWPFLDEG
ncbi:M1 family peptidase, partial [bacterium]